MRSSFIDFFLALLLLALAGVGYGLWYSYVAGESGEAAHLSDALAANESADNESRAFQNALASLGSDQSSLQNYFVSESNVVPFFEALQSLASSLGATLTVQSVSYGSGSDNPMLTVAFQISGSFSAVARAVGAIEHAPYAITTTGLALTQTNNGWMGVMNATVGSFASSTP